MAYAVFRRYILVFNCDVYFILRKFEHGSNLKQRKGPKPLMVYFKSANASL